MSVLKEIVLILCDRVKREAVTNKATIDGVFTNVHLPKFPGGLNATLYMRFRVDDQAATQVTALLAFVRPNGAVEPLPITKFKVAQGFGEMGINLVGLPLLQSGRHAFVLSAGPSNTEVARTTFNVVSLEPKNDAKPDAPTN